MTEIERFRDHDFDRRWSAAGAEAFLRLREISSPILERHADEVAELQDRLNTLRAEADELVADIEAHNDMVRDELLAAAPDISELGFPDLREVQAEDWEEPLFDSDRDYVEQIDRYKDFQGKPTERKGGARPVIDDRRTYDRLRMRRKRAAIRAAKENVKTGGDR